MNLADVDQCEGGAILIADFLSDFQTLLEVLQRLSVVALRTKSLPDVIQRVRRATSSGGVEAVACAPESIWVKPKAERQRANAMTHKNMILRTQQLLTEEVISSRDGSKC